MTRQRQFSRKVVKSSQTRAIAEPLEQRRMLSVSASTPNPSAYPLDGAIPADGFPAGNASPQGFSPTQIEGAYGISGISFGGVTGTGAGQTIAIIVAYDNPNLVSSTNSGFANSDLAKFDAYYGIANPPSFLKINQSGGNVYPTSNAGWANEAALDVEWTHAIAPQANIVLVEASSTNLSDLIEGGAAFAANMSNVSVVTMSFAVNEFYGETEYDSDLQTPAGHNGVTFLAASGDNGDVGGYPAFSPNVVSVGATTLTLSGNSYGSEVGLNTSGGGISQFETKPSYQYGESKSSTFRTIPDVAVNGDKDTGLSVYDSLNGGASTPWYKIGGTSASTPVWAGLVAITDQGRAHVNLAPMDGQQQTLPRLYALNGSDYHDVTSGNNGFAAGAGYDLITGLGSPIANKLVPDLAGGATLSGTVFSDTNGDGVQDSGETGMNGYTAFIDLYSTTAVQGADFSTVSGAAGAFSLQDLPGGTYKLSQLIPAGVDLTTAADQTVTLAYGGTVSGKNIGFKPTGAVSKLGFVQQPTAVVVGDTINPAITVDVEDASGGIVTTDNSAVTLSVQTGGASLFGTLTVNAVNGVATFNDISLSTTGTMSLKASDGSLTSATSETFTVNKVPPNYGNPAQLSFAQQPFTVTENSTISPAITVQVLDSSGRLVSDDNSPVTLSIATGTAGATLGGTLTVNAVSGIATFPDISVSTAGIYTLNATDAALTSATSSSFSVDAIVYTPAKVVLTQQPTDTYIGSTIAPAIAVSVEDPNGVVVTANSSVVTLSIVTGPVGGTLGGTLSAYAVNGVATFSDITLSTPGKYVLTASDGSLTQATSVSFTGSIRGTLTPTILSSTLVKSAVGGSKVKGSVVVHEANTAAATATGNVTTTIYALQNGTLTPLGSVTRKMKVVVRQSYKISVPVKSIPVTLSGDYSLIARVTDTTGNSDVSGTGGTLQVAAPFIALAPTITKLTLLPSVVGGGKSNAVAVLKVINTGNVVSSGLTTFGIFASTDGTAATASPIATITKKVNIAAGKSVSITVPLKMLPATLNGSYQILAIVTDPKSAVTFSLVASTVKFAPPYVAFTVSDVTATPVVFSAGKSVTMSFTVTNDGNVATTGASSIVLGISNDGIAMLSQLTTINYAKPIPAGKSVTLKFRFTDFVAVNPGSYDPFVTITNAASGQSASAAGSTQVTIS